MNKISLPSSPVVNAEWLLKHLHHPNLLVLDASLKHAQNATASLVQESVQIPGARYFDIDKVFSDKQSSLPHMLPTAEDFTREARVLGICKDSVVVVYDNRGIYSSPRAWWMFKAMGHDKVYVLDGGLPAWIEAEYTYEPASVTTVVAKGDFEAKYNPDLVADKVHVLAALKDENYRVIDARPAERFQGKAPEPRPGLRLGHMPNALNIPFESVLTNGKMRPKAELKEVLKKLSLTNKKLIFSCGSGVTACITALGATIAGYADFAIYDGSWSEWGAAELPIVSSDNIQQEV
ncbi:MAG: 3-mercaptopyruvate sulfurtransferase [Pontibacter sp.]|nr:3-mercaptopyruvate sulfurtransferase [Pontibacter sp.]